MNGRTLLRKSNLIGISHKESDQENSIIVISSYHKIGQKLAYIQTEFPEAVITSVDDDCGYGLFNIRLLEEL